MISYRVFIAEAAERDIADGFTWYRERNQLAAEAFRDLVFDAIDRLAAAPLAHPADPDGTRRLVLRRFPYSVYYEVAEEALTVLAVAHHRRRPGYWKAASRRPSASK